MFSTNEGSLDRGIRIVVGLIIISLAFIGPKTPWAYLGLVPLVTGLVGYCPLYGFFNALKPRPHSAVAARTPSKA